MNEESKTKVGESKGEDVRNEGYERREGKDDFGRSYQSTEQVGLIESQQKKKKAVERGERLLNMTDQAAASFLGGGPKRRSQKESLRDEMFSRLQTPEQFFGVSNRRSSQNLSYSIDSQNSLSYVQPINPRTVNSFLQVLAYHGKLDDAKKTFEMMRDYGVEPNIYHYNSLINVCAKARAPEEALKIFQNMKRMSDIKPDWVTYGALINVLAKNGNIHRAQQILKMAVQAGYTANQHMVSTILTGYIKMGDYNTAWKFWDYLEEHKVCSRNLALYTNAFTLCAKTNQTEKAILLFNTMKDKDEINPDDVAYNAMIAACAARTDYYEEAVKYMERMKGEGHLPSLFTMNTMLHAASVNKDIKGAEQIFSDMTNSGLYDLDIVTYTSLLNTVARSQVWTKDPQAEAKADLILNEVNLRGFKIDSKFMGALLGVYTVGNNVEKAQRLMREMESRFGVVPDVSHHTSMIQMYSEIHDPEGVKNQLNSLDKTGYLIDQRGYQAIVTSCAKTYLLKSGVSYARKMIEADYHSKNSNCLRVLLEKARDLGDLGTEVDICEIADFQLPEPNIDMKREIIERIYEVQQKRKGSHFSKVIPGFVPSESAKKATKEHNKERPSPFWSK
eukprot:TRINITY_DN6772_c0_g1_i2.p1 TRINITY_DN6772_c0_g1~~TRINITY_DN6772_c0_g1_i2.p1  ORF type:complete len:706 (+),score=178.47 TRINITY_DN6772_c0_g1_i2:269-2119(+)